MAAPPPTPPPPDFSLSGNKKAQVIVGIVGKEDDQGLFDDPLDPEDYGPWTDYQIINKYEKDYHVYMVGLTSPNGATQTFRGVTSVDTVAFHQLSMPTMLWISDWTVAKYNDKPKIPTPLLVIDDWILMDEHYETAMLTLGPDGVTPCWRISGTFTYGHRRPGSFDAINLVEFGRPPWMVDNFYEFGGRTGSIDMFMNELNVAQSLVNIPNFD